MTQFIFLSSSSQNQVVSMDVRNQPQQVLSTENGREPKQTDHQHAAKLPSYLGKHRMQAAISNLNNQIDSIQKELEELEKTGESSLVCTNVISSVESIPDPVLPLTKGPVDAGWDRWFGGGSDNSTSHKRWI